VSAFFVTFSRGGSAIAAAVSPFGFDSFIKFNQEPRKSGAGLAFDFSICGFLVSRFIHYLSHALRHDFL
jgi:hypothetical protein